MPPTIAHLPQASMPEGSTTRVIALIDDGQFRTAEVELAQLLKDPRLGAQQYAELEFERERMRRIRHDFPYDRGELSKRLQMQIPDLIEAEVTNWTAQGLLEHLNIDGKVYYFEASISNLFRLSAEARARTQPPTLLKADPPLYKPHSLHAELLREFNEYGQAQVGEQRLRVKHRLELHANAVPPGAEVRAWIPFPRALRNRQENIQLIRSEPEQATIAPVVSLQRTAYLTRTAQADRPTRFEIEYELTTYGQVTRIDPEQAQRPASDAVAAEFLAERTPHVVFSPALRQYSEAILGGETQAYAVAQKLFMAVAAIPWAVAREYSTLRNISDYAMTAGHADCGQKTLLLISLLRLNGIPARWQSGWQMSPTDFDTMHDWGEFYLEPYGWMPMDVTHGPLGGNDPAIDWFYLGSIDGLRVAFNDDYSRDFDPPKRHIRSETVDSQRGEIEWEGGNLYFDQWDYYVDWERLPSSQVTGLR